MLTKEEREAIGNNRWPWSDVTKLIAHIDEQDAELASLRDRVRVLETVLAEARDLITAVDTTSVHWIGRRTTWLFAHPRAERDAVIY